MSSSPPSSSPQKVLSPSSSSLQQNVSSPKYSPVDLKASSPTSPQLQPKAQSPVSSSVHPKATSPSFSTLQRHALSPISTPEACEEDNSGVNVSDVGSPHSDFHINTSVDEMHSHMSEYTASEENTDIIDRNKSPVEIQSNTPTVLVVPPSDSIAAVDSPGTTFSDSASLGVSRERSTVKDDSSLQHSSASYEDLSSVAVWKRSPRESSDFDDEPSYSPIQDDNITSSDRITSSSSSEASTDEDDEQTSAVSVLSSPSHHASGDISLSRDGNLHSAKAEDISSSTDVKELFPVDTTFATYQPSAISLRRRETDSDGLATMSMGQSITPSHDFKPETVPKQTTSDNDDAVLAGPSKTTSVEEATELTRPNDATGDGVLAKDTEPSKARNGDEDAAFTELGETSSDDVVAKVTMPSETTRDDVVAKVTVPSETTRDDVVAKVTAPSETTSDDVVAKVTVPSETTRDDVVAKVTEPSETTSDDVVDNVTAPSETTSDDVVAKVTAPSETTSDDEVAKVTGPGGTTRDDVVAKVTEPSETTSDDVVDNVTAPSETTSDDVVAKVTAPSETTSDDEVAKVTGPGGTTRDDVVAKVTVPSETTSDNVVAKVTVSSETTSDNVVAKVTGPSETTTDDVVAKVTAPSETTSDNVVAKVTGPSETTTDDAVAKVTKPSETTSEEADAKVIAPSEITVDQVDAKATWPSKATGYNVVAMDTGQSETISDDTVVKVTAPSETTSDDMVAKVTVPHETAIDDTVVNVTAPSETTSDDMVAEVTEPGETTRVDVVAKVSRQCETSDDGVAKVTDLTETSGDAFCDAVLDKTTIGDVDDEVTELSKTTNSDVAPQPTSIDTYNVDNISPKVTQSPIINTPGDNSNAEITTPLPLNDTSKVAIDISNAAQSPMLDSSNADAGAPSVSRSLFSNPSTFDKDSPVVDPCSTKLTEVKTVIPTSEGHSISTGYNSSPSPSKDDVGTHPSIDIPHEPPLPLPRERNLLFTVHVTRPETPEVVFIVTCPTGKLLPENIITAIMDKQESAPSAKLPAINKTPLCRDETNIPDKCTGTEEDSTSGTCSKNEAKKTTNKGSTSPKRPQHVSLDLSKTLPTRRKVESTNIEERESRSQGVRPRVAASSLGSFAASSPVTAPASSGPAPSFPFRTHTQGDMPSTEQSVSAPLSLPYLLPSPDLSVVSFPETSDGLYWARRSPLLAYSPMYPRKRINMGTRSLTDLLGKESPMAASLSLCPGGRPHGIGSRSSSTSSTSSGFSVGDSRSKHYVGIRTTPTGREPHRYTSGPNTPTSVSNAVRRLQFFASPPSLPVAAVSPLPPWSHPYDETPSPGSTPVVTPLGSAGSMASFGWAEHVPSLSSLLEEHSIENRHQIAANTMPADRRTGVTMEQLRTKFIAPTPPPVLTTPPSKTSTAGPFARAGQRIMRGVSKIPEEPSSQNTKKQPTDKTHDRDFPPGRPPPTCTKGGTLTSIKSDASDTFEDARDFVTNVTQQGERVENEARSREGAQFRREKIAERKTTAKTGKHKDGKKCVIM